MAHFGARKTKAMRAAIDERARNWERPPSPVQRQALARMAEAPLPFIPGRLRHGKWGLFGKETINSLTRRGLCRIEGKQRMRACITAKGRKAIGRTA
jgi:hypothetical protein